MALPRTFANQTNPLMPWLDQNFAAVGDSLYIRCTAANNNAIVLTPVANQPTIQGYTSLQGYSFLAIGDNSGAVTIQVTGLGVLSGFKSTSAGPAALGAGDLRAGNYYVAIYDPSLSAGTGGFIVFGVLGLPTTNQNPNTIFAGPTSAVAGPPAFRQMVAADLPTPGAAGNLFIGTSASGFAQNQLTAGLNITISNGDGTVTISAAGSAAGNVIGPPSSTPGAIASFSGTTGTLLHDTGVTFGNIAKLNVQQQFTRAQRGASTTLSGSSVVIDFALTNNFAITGVSGTNFLTAINALGDQSGVLVYTQGSSGNCQIFFPGTNFIFAGGTSAAPTATLVANARDLYGYSTINSSLVFITTIGLNVKNT